MQAADLKYIFILVILLCMCNKCLCFGNSTIDEDPTALKKAPDEENQKAAFVYSFRNGIAKFGVVPLNDGKLRIFGKLCPGISVGTHGTSEGSFSPFIGSSSLHVMFFTLAVADQCSSKYSINCFLMDVYKLIDKSRATNRYQILPGIYVVKDDTSAEETAIDLLQRAVINNQTELLDVYVQKKLNAYLDALSLSVKIMDRNAAISVRKFSDNFITGLLPTINTGRGKKKGSKDSAVWAAGAIAALGSSALFAMSGKAVVASMLALLLSMMCYFKGHGSSHYTAATTGAISSPYRATQCAEAIIDVNAKDYNAALIGYKKRTLDDTWNYPRYATTPTSEPTYSSHNK